MTRTQRPLTRLVLAGVGLPALVTGIGLFLLERWRGELPDPVASHWSDGGRPDGFSSLTELLLVVGGFGLAGIVAGALVARFVHDPTAARVGVGATSGTVAFVVATAVLLTEPQRGLADAESADLRPSALLLAALVGALAALGAVLLVPRWRRESPTVGRAGTDLVLADGERAAWSRRVRSTPLLWGLGGATVVTGAVSVLAGIWWLLLGAVVLALLAALFCSVRVTVDVRGVRVRGALGWPRSSWALERIATARVVEVRALRDFGGWGYRIAVRGPLQGVRGYVLASGDGLLLEDRAGDRIVVVVDDAATAAGLVEALRERCGRVAGRD